MQETLITFSSVQLRHRWPLECRTKNADRRTQYLISTWYCFIFSIGSWNSTKKENFHSNSKAVSSTKVVNLGLGSFFVQTISNLSHWLCLLQARPTDPRKRTDVADDLPPWRCMPTNGPTIELPVRGISSASSIAAYQKRDAAGTLLVDVATSEAGHGDSKPSADREEVPAHNAASSSSRPPKDWRFIWLGIDAQTDEFLPFYFHSWIVVCDAVLFMIFSPISLMIHSLFFDFDDSFIAALVYAFICWLTILCIIYLFICYLFTCSFDMMKCHMSRKTPNVDPLTLAVFRIPVGTL